MEKSDDDTLLRNLTMTSFEREIQENNIHLSPMMPSEILVCSKRNQLYVILEIQLYVVLL